MAMCTTHGSKVGEEAGGEGARPQGTGSQMWFLEQEQKRPQNPFFRHVSSTESEMGGGRASAQRTVLEQAFPVTG